MKNSMTVILVLFFIVILSNYGLAEDFKAGGSLNYYSVTDSIYKDTYGKGNLMFGCSLSYEVIRKLELRAEANYFRDKGGMTKTKEEITFTIIPIVLGVRYKVLELNRLSPYLGAGVDFYFYKEDVPPRFEDVLDSTTGFHIEVGSYVNVIHGFYLDLNVRYIRANAKSDDETIKLGGFRAGIGMGYCF